MFHQSVTSLLIQFPWLIPLRVVNSDYMPYLTMQLPGSDNRFSTRTSSLSNVENRSHKASGIRWFKPVITLISVLFVWLSLSASAQADNGLVQLPRFPSISPDGTEVVFSWGGDLWRVSAGGGQADRLRSEEHTSELQ